MQLQNKRFIGGLLFLVALSATVHWQWLILPGIFTEGDWWYTSNDILRDFLSMPKLLNGIEDFTTGSQTPMFLPLMIIGGLMTFITEHAFALWERVLFLWPIALLGTIPMYILLYRRNKSVTAAVAGTLVYAFNSYILARETAHLFIAVAYLIFAPLLLLMFDRLLRKPSLTNGFFFTITTIAFCIYEIRILYIFTLVLLAYTAYRLFTKKDQLSWRFVRTSVLCVAIIILSQSYWLLPFTLSNSSLGYASFASRGLFQSFTTVYHAIGLSDPAWTGEAFKDFTTQPLSSFAYGIPLIAFCWIIAKPRKEKGGDLWFWTAVALIGIFLAKQSNPPFPGAYQWIFDHLPGFRLFRDASKFFLYIGFSYAILISATISYMQKRRKTLVIAPLLFIGIVTLLQVLPLIQGTLQALITPYNVPKTYVALRTLLEKDTSFGRSLWIPSSDRFILESKTHPRVNAGNIVYGDWKPFVEDLNDPYSFFSQPNAKAFLNFGSIAYIGTPYDATDGIYRWHPRTQNGFSELIEEIPGLEKIVQQEDPGITLWENSGAKPHTYIADTVTVTDTNPKEYTGDDERRTNATIFRPHVSLEMYSSLLKTLATGWTIRPFAAENLVVKDGILQTTATFPQQDQHLTTRDKKSEDDIVEQLIIRRNKDAIELATTNSDQQTTITKLEVPDIPFTLQINGKKFTPLNPGSEYTPIGVARLKEKENTIEIYIEKEHTDPFIENASFEDGLWGSVGDCNNINGSNREVNKISASLKEAQGEGKYALLLSAGNHIGCMQAIIAHAEEATQYILSFDYKHIQGDGASVKVLSDTDPSVPLASADLNTFTNWTRKEIPFSVPPTHTSPFQLFLYQPGSIQDQKIAESMFDNFHVVASKKIQEKKFDFSVPEEDSHAREFTQNDIQVPIPHGYTPEDAAEDGTFQDKAAYNANDCANINKSSLAKNGIEANVQEENGKSQLVIVAKKHLACVSVGIKALDTTFNYLLSFQYKKLQGGSPAIALYPNPANTLGPQELPPVSDSSWHTFKKIIHGSEITGNTQLILYSSPATSPSKVAFADIQMVKIPILPERAITSTGTLLPSLNETSHIIQPTMHSVLSDPVLTPRLLILSDRYDTGWRLFVRPQGAANLSWWQRLIGMYHGTEISKDSHIKTNAFVNGWILDPEEIGRTIGENNRPEFIIEYWPQRLMNIGTAVSVLTLLLWDFAIFLVAIFRRKPPAQSPQPPVLAHDIHPMKIDSMPQ